MPLISCYSEGMFVVDDAAAAIRDYASQGYDLVMPTARSTALPCRKLRLISRDQLCLGYHGRYIGQPNIFAYEAASQEGGYVNGVLAGDLTTSKVIGVVGPIETGDAKLLCGWLQAGRRGNHPRMSR